MNKVYFNKENQGCWFVEELEDYYNFKAVDFQTNEESYHILSWTRNYSLDDLDQEVVRVYDVEIEEKKYYFIVKADRYQWDVISKDPMELEKLLRDKNLFFVGDTKIVE